MLRITVVSTKGGVGKTTLSANPGAILADCGIRVLLLDVDIQPSLSTFYPVEVHATAGLSQVIHSAQVTPDVITQTALQNLDIITSDDPKGMLANWILDAPDGRLRLKRALDGLAETEAYDCVIIDTQGAAGPLQDAAVLAADLLLSPITPETLSAKEFLRGTIGLLDRLEPMSYLGAPVPPLKAVIYAQSRTRDARQIATRIRDEFITLRGRITVLDTWIPAAKAYTEASTLQIPVHIHEPERTGSMPATGETMRALVSELFPNLSHLFAPPATTDVADTEASTNDQ